MAAEPALTADDTHYVEYRRKARSQAFTDVVRYLYDNTCAVCGSQRETPAGDPEVEAAHIYPKSENGRDDIRNGIALCKFHHWAFDTGWLAITEDYDLLVADVPDRNGYHEFKQLEGQSVALPDDEDARLDPLYLEHIGTFMGLTIEFCSSHPRICASNRVGCLLGLSVKLLNHSLRLLPNSVKHPVCELIERFVMNTGHECST